ncbi:MAG: uroporphyrinogen-III synthase, partial [Proteobacteria bacterium]|nr:uroporphyrinogen-III synthase [Pseudomonadota bacterium]
MKLLITRPLAASETLIAALLAEGHSVICSPLLDIQFRTLQVLDLQGVQGFIVTSINGVEGLSRSIEVRDLPIYCVGDKTAEEAGKKGFSNVKSADGDIHALQQLICHQVDPEKGILLHAGGARLAGDLKRALEKEGYQYRREILYDAVDATALTAEVKTALTAGELLGVLLFSPHTAKVFCKLVDDATINTQIQKLNAWCLSQNVATELANCGFANMYISDHPSERALLDLIRDTSNVTMAGSSKFNQGLKEQVVSDKSKKDIPNTSEKMKQSDISPSKAGAKTSVPASGANKPAGNQEKASASSTATAATSMPKPDNPSNKVVRNLVVLLVVFMLGLAVWPLILPSVSSLLPEATRALVQGTSENPSELAALKAQVQNLQNQSPQISNERFVALENQIGQLKSTLATQSDNDFGVLSDRLESLEANLSQIGETVADLQARTTDNMVSRSDNGVGAVPMPSNSAELFAIEKTLLALKEELQSLRQAQTFTQNDLKAQKSEIQTLNGTVEAGVKSASAASANGTEAVTLLALGQLHRESRTNGPFEGAWQQAVATAPNGLQNTLSELSNISKVGAPTLR